MLLVILSYIILISLAGLFSIGLSRRELIFPYFASGIISLCSLGALGYILWYFLEINWQVRFFQLPWALPFARFSVGLDSLSLFFMVPLLILATACSVYGSRYFKDHFPGMLQWLHYALLLAGMALVLLARNAILFIMAWELISLASFFLVITDAEAAEVRRAGWIYLISAHVGTAFLITAFFLLAAPVQSFEFSDFALANYSSLQLNLIFICALIGFGMKAGFIPFHIWLPLAHPAAPSHVSALMSGIMIKMGIYAIFRILLLTHSYQGWWGALLVLLGAVSGVIGVLFAIGEHDIKRLLGYHSVENIGIIMLGMGVGILGIAYQHPIVAILGFAGALLHVVNHAIFKALLFLGAGAIIRQTGLRDIDKLGGLIKRLPGTAWLFLLGSAAISGLPFFSGFISEIFIYAAAVIGTVEGAETLFPMLTAIVIIALAIIGALATACFAKVFGIIFLGTGRDQAAATAQPAPRLMLAGMTFLAMFIVFIGLCSITVVPFVAAPVEQLVGSTDITIVKPLMDISENLSLAIAIALALVLMLLSIRFFILKRVARFAETWGCGYSLPEPASMQYTASSFAEPFTSTCKTVLNLQRQDNFTKEFFPRGKWSFSTHTNDWILHKIFIPTVKFVDKLLALLRWIQCGKAGLYVLYIVVTLLGLIIWMFFVWK